MRRIYCTFLAILVLSICGGASAQVKNGGNNATSDPYENRKLGFRGSPWGASEESVKAREHLTLVSQDTSLILYDGEVLGFPATIGYNFYRGKLYSGAIHFHEKHSNPNLYIDDYMLIRKQLIALYAEPENSGKYWSNDTFKGSEQNYGIAVSMGYLSYGSTWTFMPGEIDLELYGDNYKIFLDFQATNSLFAPPKAPPNANEF